MMMQPTMTIIVSRRQSYNDGILDTMPKKSPTEILDLTAIVVVKVVALRVTLIDDDDTINKQQSQKGRPSYCSKCEGGR